MGSEFGWFRVPSISESSLYFFVVLAIGLG